jgi:hypothetical protein
MAKSKSKKKQPAASSAGAGVPDQTGDFSAILDRIAACRALVDMPALVSEARSCLGKSSPMLSAAIDAIEASQTHDEIAVGVACAREVLAEATGGE